MHVLARVFDFVTSLAEYTSSGLSTDYFPYDTDSTVIMA